MAMGNMRPIDDASRSCSFWRIFLRSLRSLSSGMGRERGIRGNMARGVHGLIDQSPRQYAEGKCYDQTDSCHELKGRGNRELGLGALAKVHGHAETQPVE